MRRVLLGAVQYRWTCLSALNAIQPLHACAHHARRVTSVHQPMAVQKIVGNSKLFGSSRVFYSNHRTTGIIGHSNAKRKLHKHWTISRDCSGGKQYLIYHAIYVYSLSMWHKVLRTYLRVSFHRHSVNSFRARSALILYEQTRLAATRLVWTAMILNCSETSRPLSNGS